jgi:meiotically up-regulated gene 157 (Mug157) protein
MPIARLTAALLIATVLSLGIARPAAGEPAPLAAKLEKIYLTAIDEAINRHAFQKPDGTTYVSTGDIEADWLRDTSAVVAPYIGVSGHDPRIAGLLRGVVARQAKYIMRDPYANAFGSDYSVVERKFEVDSLLYPIWFAHRYWRETHDTSIFTPEVNRAFERVLSVLRTESHHATQSGYRHPQLANNGKGSAVAYTGMVWTGFRPSDDPVRYHYNIPVNMFAVVVLGELAAIEREVYHNRTDEVNAWGFALQIQRAVERHGTVYLPGFGRIYAYEVDGLGHANVMDDANVPSLLSIPYFGYLSARDPQYKATRAFALSQRNPYFFSGKLAQGIGSPHTPSGYVWPLALIMQALTSTDDDETRRVLGYLALSDTGDHRLHESFDASAPDKFTRDDFAWPNALYAEMVMNLREKLPIAFVPVK